MNLCADTLYNFENEKDEARFNNLIKDIRCPKCISGSLSSSNAPISEDLKLKIVEMIKDCLLYTSPSPRDATLSRMPSSA